MMETIPPHGGQLINRIIAGEEREDWLKRAEEIPGWAVPPMILSDLECIATGVFSPLTGFLNEEDYLAVRDRMRLADGTVWTLPITLPVPEDRAADVREGKPVAIRGEDGRIYAVVEVESLYRVDRRKEAREVFRTEDAKHPGVARLYRSSPLRAGGPIWLLESTGSRTFQPVHPGSGGDPQRDSAARLAPDRRLPDAEPDPSGPRIYPKGGPGDGGRTFSQPVDR